MRSKPIRLSNTELRIFFSTSWLSTITSSTWQLRTVKGKVTRDFSLLGCPPAGSGYSSPPLGCPPSPPAPGNWVQLKGKWHEIKAYQIVHHWAQNILLHLLVLHHRLQKLTSSTIKRTVTWDYCIVYKRCAHACTMLIFLLTLTVWAAAHPVDSPYINIKNWWQKQLN